MPATGLWSEWGACPSQLNSCRERNWGKLKTPGRKDEWGLFKHKSKAPVINNKYLCCWGVIERERRREKTIPELQGTEVNFHENILHSQVLATHLAHCQFSSQWQNYATWFAALGPLYLGWLKPLGWLRKARDRCLENNVLAPKSIQLTNNNDSSSNSNYDTHTSTNAF